MRPKVWLLIFILLAISFVFYQFFFQLSPPGEKNQISKIPQIGHYYAPDFNLKDIEGNEVSLDSLAGNDLLLVFWTTWCKWCTKEKPFLKEFAISYGDKIKLIGINIQESKEVVKKHVEEFQLNFPTLLDETGKVAQDYNIRTHPTHVLINKDGKILAIRPGYADYHDFEELAKIILEE